MFVKATGMNALQSWAIFRLPILTAKSFRLVSYTVSDGTETIEDPSTSVAERLLDLLECLSSSPMTAREISETCGIPLSTAHRLLRPLVARKYVLRQGRGRYLLGIASMELGARADLDSTIKNSARPIIAELAKNCSRTVHLGVLRDNLVRYLVKVDAGCSRPPSREMTELEAYCTGIGKVLLAQLTDDQLEEYLAPGDFVSLTHNTIWQTNALRQEISDVRRQGWAIDRGEMYSQLRCLAVPIADRAGRLMAALSVTEVCTEETSEEVEETLLTLLPRMAEAAEEISVRLSVR